MRHAVRFQQQAGMLACQESWRETPDLPRSRFHGVDMRGQACNSEHSSMSRVLLQDLSRLRQPPSCCASLKVAGSRYQTLIVESAPQPWL